VEIIDVGLQIWRQQCGVYELSAVGSHGKILPHKIALELRVLLTHDNVLNSDAELPIFVKPGLIRDAHAYFELSCVSSTDATWTLMHVQEMSNTMTGTMPKVKTNSPKSLTSQDVNVLTADAVT